MKKILLSGVLSVALASAVVSDANAGAAAPPTGGSNNDDVIIAVFVIALGTLIFGQGFGTRNRNKDQTRTKKSADSEY